MTLRTGSSLRVVQCLLALLDDLQTDGKAFVIDGGLAADDA
jgi:hypothetical protein